MKIWKVILATLVIFAAGAFTGALVVKSTQPTPVKEFISLPGQMFQGRVLEQMKKELNLTPEQNRRMEEIFSENHKRMKILWDLINPEVQAELKEVRDKVRAELTPEQRTKFEEMLKHPPQRRFEGPRRPRSGTNSSNDAKMMSPKSVGQ